MLEISGLAISDNQVYFASDREHDLLNIALDADNTRDVNLDNLSKVDLQLNIPSNQQAQWEAIAVSANEGVFLAKETGSEIFHYTQGGQLLKKYKLKTWEGRKNPDRGFEGIFLLNNGHFLIALEADPAALIEYGPAGDSPVGIEKNAQVKASEFNPPSTGELVPLHAWTIEKSLGGCEFSDLAEAPQGGLLILMKGCMKVAHISELKPSVQKFAVDNVYNIPGEVWHPEGLQVLPNGDFLIATDIKDVKTNLYRLSF